MDQVSGNGRIKDFYNSMKTESEFSDKENYFLINGSK
jgi:hypothetical protein